MKIPDPKILFLAYILFCFMRPLHTMAQNIDLPKALKPYASCHFADGLQITKLDKLADGTTARSVDTANGTKYISLKAGLRIMFAYPFADFYANVKSELLPTEQYTALKADLMDNLNHLLVTSPGEISNQSLPSPLHSFEVHGHDRSKLEGGVLGMYLLFDDSTQVVTTIYFLNQETFNRKFQTLDEYRRLRDQFLTTYTGCIRENQEIYR
jgi:hypothetical protein